VELESQSDRVTHRTLTFKLRSEFIEKSFARFNTNIAHLEKKVLDLALSLNPPTVDTPKERKHIANALNQIYIESFDNAALKNILTNRKIPSDKLGNLRCLEAILKSVSPSQNAHSIMTPFYVVYDFRVLGSHISGSSSLSKLESITKRLGLTSAATLLQIYEQLIKDMTASLKKMIELVETP
jgi:hypothetical protein